MADKSQLTAASRPTTSKQPVKDSSMLYGGSDVPIYLIKDTEPKAHEVLSIFEHPEHERITFTPPCRPKGTEVYLISTGCDPNKKFDVRADQYTVNSR
ncbi:uncharacterized protein LOC124277449 isoform X2 [Haliotis rubra]|uniref:uncharacterized protein LOC124277449 isoform X2 n=1 Tax=Haliotis rubra TaxID=36100 RepID=UPI001EE5744D|nr:uncharacterized protein LOC124277449 isoform X2 [Haliotis rubra]